MNELELAKYINASEPLNRFRISEDIKNKIDEYSVIQKINMLIFSFQSFDKNYNSDLCLTYRNLWNGFTETDWKNLILQMFPRKVKYVKGDLREINTGAYFDIVLLNGIIGVSPFKFIFNELKIDEIEKESFLNYLKFYGEVCFFCNERELIEDVVNFYELEVFSDIVNMKDRLIAGSSFKASISHFELLNQFVK